MLSADGDEESLHRRPVLNCSINLMPAFPVVMLFDTLHLFSFFSLSFFDLEGEFS